MLTFTSTMTGASANYERYLFEQPTLLDRYGDSLLLDFALAPIDASFVKLRRGAYITLATAAYPTWFTGYITNDPELVHLGSKGGQSVWGYRYQATSDLYALSIKPLGLVPTFFNMSMGAILKALIERAQPGVYNTAGIQDGPIVAQYVVDPTKKFFDVGKEFSDSASFVLACSNKVVTWVPQDDASIPKVTLDGNNKHFTPARLQLKPSSDNSSSINDVTVLGQIEPQAYMHEYFVGTGLDAAFPLIGSVFGADTSVLIDEPFAGSGVDGTKWEVNDTVADFLQIHSGYMNSLGGSGTGAYDVNIRSAAPISLEGRIRFTHGDWDFLGGVGIIAGLWTGAVASSMSGCLYGLKVNGTSLQPIVNGALDTSQSVTVDIYGDKRYVIRTVVEFEKTNRLSQAYNYLSSAGTVESFGGSVADDIAIWDTLISEVAVSNGEVTNSWRFRNTANMTGSASGYASYVPLASDTLQASFTGITVSVPINATLEMSDQAPLNNQSFTDWDDINTPTGWTNAVNVFKETVYTDGGFAAKLAPDGGGLSYLEQLCPDAIAPATAYNVSVRLRRTAGMTSGVVHIYLQGDGVSDPGISIPYTSISTAGYLAFDGEITAGIPSIPDNLLLKVDLVGAASGQAVWVDNLHVTSNFTQRLIGPNEIDGLDGQAPTATIVASSLGADSKSSYLGTPQYNPGQSQLTFFKDSVTQTSNVPPENQIIRLSYRSAGPAIGRAVSRASIASESQRWKDDGTRSITKTDIVPRPRNSAECELAAAAIVAQESKDSYEGTYEQWSDYFTSHPRSGGIIEFLNLSAMAPVSVEEINSVTTTLESHRPVERFRHVISFGKGDAASRMFSQFSEVKGAYQRSADYAVSSPIDISSVGTAFAGDVTKPDLMGWNDDYIFIDPGENLGADDLYFEARYTDEGWGVDDGKNLIIRTQYREIAVPRNRRGRVCFIRKARKGNHVLWSEDQTKTAVYSGVSMSGQLSPYADGLVTKVSTGSFGSGSSLSASLSGLTGSAFCGTISIKGPAGKTVSLALGASTQSHTMTGFWQRISVSRSGSAPSAFSLTYTGSGTASIQTTRWSVEQGLVESQYAKTTDAKYGPVSRYSACVHVAFPASFTAEVAAPTPPGPVTIDSAVGKFETSTRYKLELAYTPPAEMNDFEGVHVWEETVNQSDEEGVPLDGSILLNGGSNLGGNWTPIDRGRFTGSPAVLLFDDIVDPVTKRFYLTSFSQYAESALVRATEPDATPNILHTITPEIYALGEEYTRNVSSPTATVEIDDTHVTGPKYRIVYTCVPPSDPPSSLQKPYGGCQIVYEYDDGRRTQGPIFAVNETEVASDWYDLYVGISVIKHWFTAFDNSEEPRSNTIVTGVTPSATTTVTWPLLSRTPGAEYADNVTNFVVNAPRVEVNALGQKEYNFDWSWTRPTTAAAIARWGGSTIWVEIPGDPKLHEMTGADTGDSGTISVTALPIISETWNFRAISRDNNGNVNTYVLGVTPEVSLTVAPPATDVADVTAFTVTAAYRVNASGQYGLIITPIFTPPSDPQWGGMRFVVEIDGDPATYWLGDPGESGPRGEATIVDFPVNNENWAFRAYSMDVNQRVKATYVRYPTSGYIVVGPPPLGVAGVERAAHATGVSFAVATEPGSDGTTQQKITATFTAPVDPLWGGVELRVYNGATLVTSSKSSKSPLSVFVPNPTSSVTYTVKLVSYDVNDRSNTEHASTPAGTVLVGSAAGTLDLRKYLPASSDNFNIVGAVLRIKTGVAMEVDASGHLRVAVNGITSSLISSGAVGVSQLLDNAVTDLKLAANAVTAAKIAANAVTAPAISASAVTAGKIAANAVTAGTIAANAVTSAEILAGSITTNKIAAGAVTATEIAALAIVAGKIAANAVTAVEIAANSIIAGKIAADAIAANNIIAGVISSDKLDTNFLNVGGGGSKPGQIRVFNASAVQVGFIGVNGGYEGAWFKQIGIGGTSEASPKFISDSSGNVSMNGATFTLNLNGITTEITNSFSGSYYAGLRVYNNSSPTQQIRVFPAGGVWVEDSSTTRCIVNGSAVNLIYASANTIALNGALGTINLAAGSPGYYVNGNQVVGPRLVSVGTVVGTAGFSYTATEMTMINDCKTAINQLIARLQSHGLTS
jgi:hypothetical protein